MGPIAHRLSHHNDRARILKGRDTKGLAEATQIKRNNSLKSWMMSQSDGKNKRSNFCRQLMSSHVFSNETMALIRKIPNTMGLGSIRERLIEIQGEKIARMAQPADRRRVAV